MSGSYFFDSQLAAGSPLEYVTDKERSCKAYMNYMNIRLQKMFTYKNLPESIPEEMLEYYLMNLGTCYISRVDTTEGKNELYALKGSFGGPPDGYYRPTLYIVANPGLNFSKQFNLKEDGVLVRNDPLWVGLYPLMSRYASMMAENMVTMRMADIMLRVVAMMSAPDDATKAAAEEYLRKLEKGDLGVIGENRFFDEGVKLQSPPSNNGSFVTQFIELHQYLIGTFWNEVGLNANFNMKRESIGEGESSLNEDSLLPLAEIMLKTRKEDMDKVNKMFGTSIEVEFDSAWANNQKEVQLSLEKLQKEASQLAEGGEINGAKESTTCNNSDSNYENGDEKSREEVTGIESTADDRNQDGTANSSEGNDNAGSGQSDESSSGLEDTAIKDAIIEVAAEIVAEIIDKEENNGNSKDD